MITARTFWVNARSRIRHKRGRRRQPRVAVREYRDNHKARLALRSSLRPACRQKRVRSLTPRCANPSVAAVPAICRIGASCKRAGACNTAGQRARSGVKRKRSTRSAKLVLGNGSAHVGLVGARRDREPWSRSGASQIPEAIECSAFTPAAACWSSGDRLAPRGRGLALRRRWDRPASNQLGESFRGIAITLIRGAARLSAVETNRPVEAVVAAQLKPDGSPCRLRSRRSRASADAGRAQACRSRGRTSQSSISGCRFAWRSGRLVAASSGAAATRRQQHRSSAHSTLPLPPRGLLAGHAARG